MNEIFSFRKWRNACEVPQLWKDVKLRLSSARSLESVSTVRAHLLSEIEVMGKTIIWPPDPDPRVWHDGWAKIKLYKDIFLVERRGLKSFKVYNTLHRRIPYELIEIAFLKLETIHFRYCLLSREQLMGAYNALLKNDVPCLRDIDISGSDHVAIPPHLIGNTLPKFSLVCLDSCNLDTSQLISLYEGLVSVKGKTPERLSLSGNNHDFVPPFLLTETMKKVKSLRLVDCTLTNLQLTSIYRTVYSKGTKDKLRINLSWNDHSGVDSTLLADAYSRIRCIKLTVSSLSTIQIEKILEMINKNPIGHIKTLDLSANNHIQVRPFVLASAITRVRLVRLNLCNFCKAQYKAISIVRDLISHSSFKTVVIDSDEI